MSSALGAPRRSPGQEPSPTGHLRSKGKLCLLDPMPPLSGCWMPVPSRHRPPVQPRQAAGQTRPCPARPPLQQPLDSGSCGHPMTANGMHSASRFICCFSVTWSQGMRARMQQRGIAWEATGHATWGLQPIPPDKKGLQSHLHRCHLPDTTLHF